MTAKPIIADLSYEDGEFHLVKLLGEDITHVILAAFGDGADFAAKIATNETDRAADEALEDAFEQDTAFTDDTGFTQRWTAEHAGLPLEIAVSMGLDEIEEDIASMYDRWADAARAGGIDEAVLKAKRGRVVEALENAMRIEGLEADQETLAAIARAVALLPGGLTAMAAAIREGGVDPIESVAAVRMLAAA